MYIPNRGFASKSFHQPDNCQLNTEQRSQVLLIGGVSLCIWLGILIWRLCCNCFPSIRYGDAWPQDPQMEISPPRRVAPIPAPAYEDYLDCQSLTPSDGFEAQYCTFPKYADKDSTYADESCATSFTTCEEAHKKDWKIWKLSIL